MSEKEPEKLTKEQRDEMRKANPEIDELLYARYFEADNGASESVEHGEFMDELQDEISELVGEENFDDFWEDYEADRRRAA
jgi:hypothetical protein